MKALILLVKTSTRFPTKCSLTIIKWRTEWIKRYTELQGKSDKEPRRFMNCEHFTNLAFWNLGYQNLIKRVHFQFRQIAASRSRTILASDYWCGYITHNYFASTISLIWVQKNQFFHKINPFCWRVLPENNYINNNFNFPQSNSLMKSIGDFNV